MNREAFKSRLKQYKEARELNPLLKYWEWKQEVPAMQHAGEVEGELTENEYITQQIQNKIQSALHKSRVRLYPRVPTTEGRKSEERWRNDLNKSIEYYRKSASNPNSPYFIRQQNSANLRMAQQQLALGYDAYIGEGAIIGPSCAYTTADNYGMDFIGSEAFRNSASSYGFKEIPYSQKQPGDIVIDTDNAGKATHMLMYDGKDVNGVDRFNASNGGHTKEAIRHRQRYPFKKGDPLAFTYVGTPADSTEWKKQYSLRSYEQAGEVEGDELPLWLRNGGYKGPQYSQRLEYLKQNNSAEYDQLMYEVARNEQPNSEIIRFVGADGKMHARTNLPVNQQDVLLDAVGAVTPVGELGEALDVYDAVMDGDYLAAGFGTVGFLLPGAFGKMWNKYTRPFLRRLKRNQDIINKSPNELLSNLNEQLDTAAQNVLDNELKRLGIHEYVANPNLKREMRYASDLYRNRVIANQLHITDVFDYAHKKFLTSRNDLDRQRVIKLMRDDPRYGDFLMQNPDLDPLDPNTVDAFVKKQNTFLRGVYSPVDDDQLVKEALTVNPSDPTKKIGGDRLNTSNTGIYVSNSGEIANKFLRSFDGSARSDVGLLYKEPATDINTPIEERLSAERRRILPFDISHANLRHNYDVDKLVDMGYVAKESQYTTRLGNKLPGYERVYISKERDVPNLEILDLQTTKGNLEDLKGRWGVGGVLSQPELEAKLFEGNNIGTSYGDYLHHMRNTYKHVATIPNERYFEAKVDLMPKIVRHFVERREKIHDFHNKIKNNSLQGFAADVLANPYMTTTFGLSTAGIGGILYNAELLDKQVYDQLRKEDSSFYNFSQRFYNDFKSPDEALDAFRQLPLEDQQKFELDVPWLKEAEDQIPSFDGGGDVEVNPDNTDLTTKAVQALIDKGLSPANVLNRVPGQQYETPAFYYPQPGIIDPVETLYDTGLDIPMSLYDSGSYLLDGDFTNAGLSLADLVLPSVLVKGIRHVPEINSKKYTTSKNSEIARAMERANLNKKKLQEWTEMRDQSVARVYDQDVIDRAEELGMTDRINRVKDLYENDRVKLPKVRLTRNLPNNSRGRIQLTKEAEERFKKGIKPKDEDFEILVDESLTPTREVTDHEIAHWNQYMTKGSPDIRNLGTAKRAGVKTKKINPIDPNMSDYYGLEGEQQAYAKNIYEELRKRNVNPYSVTEVKKYLKTLPDNDSKKIAVSQFRSILDFVKFMKAMPLIASAGAVMVTDKNDKQSN